jgi:ElaB/YqjD/DUF883 family membrane-anchored ribosome-binding protein
MEAGIQASLEALLESLRGTIQTTKDQCIEETQKQLVAVRESTLASLESEAAEKSTSHLEQLRSALADMQAQQTREIGTEFQASLQSLLESLHVRIQSTEEQCVGETQKLLAALRQTTLASLESEAAEKSTSCREQLRTALLQMQAQQTKEMETGLQTSLQGLFESVRARIQSTADEAAARVSSEIKSSAEQALHEIPDRLSQTVGMAAVISRDWVEQAKTELEAHSRQLLEVFERRLEASSAAAQKRQRSEAEAFKGMLQSFLKQAEGLPAEVSKPKAEAREESGEPPSPPPQPPSHPSSTNLESPAERQRRIIEEAMNRFRSALAGQAPKR